MSLFNDPYIHSYKINEDATVLNVYFMGKECGYINITSTKINSIISCGIKSFKGFMYREDVEFEYINENFIITDTRTKKIVLKINDPTASCRVCVPGACERVLNPFA
jgi:hypothetical protein